MHLDSPVSPAPLVAEIQGLYGAFSFPEKLLQKIWQRGEFDRGRAFTIEGEPVEILRAGKWNLLGGPDFKDARIRIGTTIITGDVEVHLRAADWVAHGHARDPAYRKVILHVVLFAEKDRVTIGFEGQKIPLLAMLPLLRHDLEEYAADDAVERLAHHPLAQTEEKLLALSSTELCEEMERQARARWERKVHFARVRLARFGWECACHETALEIFGYRFNRSPMLSVALEFPLEVWRLPRAAEIETIADQAYREGQSRWKLQGVRPANHPRVRLRQYADWISLKPDWPAQLEAIGQTIGAETWRDGAFENTAEARRNLRLGDLREAVLDNVCAHALGGTRFDTLICDGFLPLWSARGQEGVKNGFGEVWRHWFQGDFPVPFFSLLKALGLIDGRRHPASHGIAQGLLGWMLTQEAAR